MTYKIGDEILLNVEEDFGHKEKTKKQIKVQIISSRDTGLFTEFLCYVPPHFINKKSFKLTQHDLKMFQVEKKFLDDDMLIIDESTIIIKHIPTTPGECCDNCNSFMPWSVRTETKIYCRSCKENPWR